MGQTKLRQKEWINRTKGEKVVEPGMIKILLGCITHSTFRHTGLPLEVGIKMLLSYLTYSSLRVLEVAWIYDTFSNVF